MNQKKKKWSQRKWFWRIGFGVVLATVVILVAMVFMVWRVSIRSSCGVTQVEKLTNITLPESVQDFDADCLNFQGFTINARFEINPDDLPILLASSNIPSPLATALPKWIRSPYAEARYPDDVLYGEYNGNDRYEEVIVDTSYKSNNTYTVYIFVGAG